MELYSVFVTGANRGIGLGLVNHLVQLPKPPKYVFATYRSRNGIEDLKSIRDTFKKTNVLLIKMDVTKKSEIEAARKITEDVVGDKGLTLLINNAGVGADQRFPRVTEENLLYHFKTNTIGPFMVTQEFLPLLQKAAALNGAEGKMEVSKAAVLNISSVLGSIVHVEEYFKTESLDCVSYDISKAGLNMAMRIIAAILKKMDILVVMICPGDVKTDMNTQAQMEVKDSVSAIIKTMTQLNEKHHGEFMDRNGKPYKF